MFGTQERTTESGPISSSPSGSEVIFGSSSYHPKKTKTKEFVSANQHLRCKSDGRKYLPGGPMNFFQVGRMICLPPNIHNHTHTHTHICGCVCVCVFARLHLVFCCDGCIMIPQPNGAPQLGCWILPIKVTLFHLQVTTTMCEPQEIMMMIFQEYP